MMSNHFHLLLEVPPKAEGGLSDEELLKRLSGLYPEDFGVGVAKELEVARKLVADGRASETRVAEIHARFTCRMHDLSEFEVRDFSAPPVRKASAVSCFSVMMSEQKTDHRRRAHPEWPPLVFLPRSTR